jgi:hypothetical protein
MEITDENNEVLLLLRQFLRNSQQLNRIMWRFVILNCKQISREIWEVKGRHLFLLFTVHIFTKPVLLGHPCF